MIEDYRKARKAGLRQVQQDVSAGRYPYPPALSEIIKDRGYQGEVPIGVVEIDMALIAGTRTQGRQNSFSRGFMPLLEETSEFAAKWSALIDSQREEGLRDPIIVYEYMQRFYVQEGNKRVSVMRYLEMPTITASVTRMLPMPSDSKESRIYQEFLRFYRVCPIYGITFSEEGSYERLAIFAGQDLDHPWPDERVADLRASTPTDAAKRVVPDIQAELEQLDLGRTRLRAAIRARIEREQSGLDAMRSRPVLENPSSILAGRADEIRSRISLARTLIGSRLDRAADEVSHLGRQVRALSPLATLERGYAVVQTADGTIIRAPEQSEVGEALSVRVAGGRFGALHVDTDPYTPPAPQAPTDDRARPEQDRTENDEETA